MPVTTSVETYFTDGCGRCALFATPDCKVHYWTEELAYLRNLVLRTGLKESCKWGVPSYTYKNKNIVIISAFKANCCISFFKGSLIDDTFGLLEKAGENSQSSMVIRFTSLDQIVQSENEILNLIDAAINVEKARKKVDFKKEVPIAPDELIQIFINDPLFKEAFEALTPGRQRGYLLYFSEAKQAKTRTARIQKYRTDILNGIGMNDKYLKKRP